MEVFFGLTPVVHHDSLHYPLDKPSVEGPMSNVALSPAVVAAGRVPAFILAVAHLAELPAPLASLTTPARFQRLCSRFGSHERR
jgi:hypothetical protein